MKRECILQGHWQAQHSARMEEALSAARQDLGQTQARMRAMGDKMVLSSIHLADVASNAHLRDELMVSQIMAATP